jgi:hypothetical protein
MGCCNTRTLNDDPKSVEDDKQVDRFSEIENKFSKKTSDKMISKATTLFESEMKRAQTVEQNEFNGNIDTEKNAEKVINGVDDIVEIKNEDIVQDTLKSEDNVNIKEAKVNTEESENVIKKIKKHRISLTICPSSPQKLDPDKVFFIEKKDISDIKPFNSEDVELAARHKLARIGTIDRVLEEKIRNKTNFDDLLDEEIFKKIIK